MNMKRFVLTCIISLVWTVSLFAYKLDSNTVFYDDGITLKMNSDGTCLLQSPETGTLYGTYDITSHLQVEPGCSRVNVLFNFNGLAVDGQILWPLQDGLMIFFDNAVTLKKIQ